MTTHMEVDTMTGKWKAGLPWPREYQKPTVKSHHAGMAWSNAVLWLEQAARGDIPHGGVQPVNPNTPMRDYTVDERPGRND